PARASYARVVIHHATGIALSALAVIWYVLGAGVVAVSIAGVARHLFTEPTEGLDPGLQRVVMLSALLNVCGIWWAMPNRRGWGPDELVPSDVLAAVAASFSHGWHDKYPPFHYLVLAAADSPLLLLSRLGVIDLTAVPAHV